jgi:hypothetical protein
MTCKRCGGEMRLWLLRAGFKSFACRTCEFVLIAREEDPQPRGGAPAHTFMAAVLSEK